MRKQKRYVSTIGRDKEAGTVFLLTEKDAMSAEWWATRAFMALAKNGIEVPEGAAQLGLQGVAAVGIKALAKLTPDDAKPLLDEMMECVSVMPDPHGNPSFTRPLVAGDVQEIATVFDLRMEVFSLHVNFSVGDAIRKSISEKASAA